MRSRVSTHFYNPKQSIQKSDKELFHHCDNNSCDKTQTSLAAHSWSNISPTSGCKSCLSLCHTKYYGCQNECIYTGETLWSTHAQIIHTLRYQTAKEKINARFPLHTHAQLASKCVRLCLQMWFHLIAGLSDVQWDITIITRRDPPSFSSRVISLSEQPLLSWPVNHASTCP